MTREADIAWFAGIFEGEGTFETTKRSTARMTIAMSDPDVIDRVEAVFPSGRPISMRDNDQRFANAKPMYAWRLGQGDELERVILAILPWLGVRRATRAHEVLAHIACRQKPGEPRSTHCKQGHKLTPDNLIRRGGAKPYVRCRTCAVEQQHAYNVRKRAARLLLAAEDGSDEAGSGQHPD